MAKEDKMIEAKKEFSKEKVDYAKEIVDIMREEGETITPYTVWRKSKLSKGFIYTNEEVLAYITQFRSDKKYNYKKYTPASVIEERIEELEKENAFLRKELRYYKSESLELLRTQNQLLERRLKKFEELVNQGIIKPPEENDL